MGVIPHNNRFWADDGFGGMVAAPMTQTVDFFCDGMLMLHEPIGTIERHISLLQHF